MKTWTKLNINEKHKHILQNCKKCLKNYKYKEVITRFPINLKNAKEKNDKNTSLLRQDIVHFLQERTIQIMASVRKTANSEFNKESNVTFKQALHYIKGEKKRQIYNEKRQTARSIITNAEGKMGI